MIADAYKEDWWSEKEMAEILEIKPGTLRQRIQNGKDHPPYQREGRQYIFPKEETRYWLKGKPIRHEAIIG